MEDTRLDRELRSAAARIIAAQTADSHGSVREPESSERLFEKLINTSPSLRRTEITLPGYGDDDISMTLVQKRTPLHRRTRPAILFFHGGGMTSGDRFFGVDEYVPWVDTHDVVLASVEYRLAPSFPDPVPVEDCYKAAVWLHDRATELRVDPNAILLVGTSAGGGLAAGVSLMLRDRAGFRPLGQMLRSPMLDDRDNSTSTLQQDRQAVWNRTANRAGWNALLGSRRAGVDVSPYAAPARAEVLSGLAPTYLDVGSEDAFRDEVAEFASGIWAAGGEAELHVWPGGFHTFDIIVPKAELSRTSLSVRDAWLTRRFQTWNLQRSQPQ